MTINFEPLSKYIDLAVKSVQLSKYNLSQYLEDEQHIAQSDPAVNAVVAAVISQEVIKSVTRQNLPIKGFFIFDGETLETKTIV